jgi:SAM-dependent methyltransferase
MYVAPIGLPSGRNLQTNVHRCRNCGVHYRDVDFDSAEIRELSNHASYTSPAREEQFRQLRHSFFLNILDLSMELLNGATEKRVLDIGCSYGHLLDLFREKVGFDTYGVEPCARLWDRLNMSNHTVFHDLDALPAELRFELITLIDVLYYCENPRSILRKVRKHLKPGGLVIVRVTNRAWIANLACSLGFKVPAVCIGHMKCSFTLKSLTMLLKQADYDVIRTITSERGKLHRDWKTRVFYTVTEMITATRFATVTPGIIVVGGCP